MSKDNAEDLAEASATLKLAANIYHGHCTIHTGNNAGSGCICPCGSAKLLKPDYDHVLGSIDALRKEVQRLGIREFEPPRPPLKIDLLVGNRSPTSYSLVTSTDSGKTWGLPVVLGDTIGSMQLFSPDKDVKVVFVIGTNKMLYYRIWDGASDYSWRTDGIAIYTSDAPAILLSKYGSFDIFVWELDTRQIKHCIWDSRYLAIGNFVSPHWQVVGSDPLSDTPPAAVSRGPALMDLFMVSGKELYWKSWHDLQWHPSPKGFTKIGSDSVSHPVAVSRHRSRLDVFTLNGTKNLLYNTWNGAEWETQQNLGGTFATIPCVVARREDRLHIFIIGTDGKLWHKTLGRRQWQPASDGEFNCMGGNFETVNLPPTVTDSRDGLDIFVVGGEQTGRMLYHRRWDGIGIPPNIDDFRRLDYWDVNHRVAALVREQAKEPEPRTKWFIT